VSEANRRHCPEERSDEGIAEAKAKPEAARPERSGTVRSERRINHHHWEK